MGQSTESTLFTTATMTVKRVDATLLLWYEYLEYFDDFD